MIRIREYLQSNREQIVKYFQDNFLPANITSNNAFDSLATELQNKFVHNHRGQTGQRDQAHNVLAMALMCSMWCGWLSQAKANREASHKNG